MKQLSTGAFQSAQDWVLTYGRPLEQALFRLAFENGNRMEVFAEIERYQNEDGGFGNGLEPDFLTPASSSLATSVALQRLLPFYDDREAQPIFRKAVRYLESTFDEERRGWYAVPKEVNDAPHAPWWAVNDSGQSGIDDTWGNPNAELIGYMTLFESYSKRLNMDFLLEVAVQTFLQKEQFESHELYSYMRLFATIPEVRSESVEEQLVRGVQQTVHLSKEDWKNYVPTPLQFVPTPQSSTYGIPERAIEENLDHLIEQLESEGVIRPTWSWGTDEDAWEQSKQDWTGIRTIEALFTLHRYGRIA
ncbi:hypothetical protein N781_01005 [Pontibacillus halophilus JSM 076056 = DSM 19796]|uniref:Uncharacterized protein n=1 Tax=Pontibacillus halophilus JSM 076056 = DSM 19796 TaxID=1385510 RepID=A0A0A5GRC4_9BACI|nr:hypothetical protein [Pontibacillus halophilus]KGX93808.1 hypothetical protein N781_01005 [Pontibacillus halophilus JSM 076056 = DSM 19796]